MLRFKRPIEGTKEPKVTGIDTSYHKTHAMRKISLEPKDNGYGVYAEFEPKKTTKTDKNSGSSKNATSPTGFGDYGHEHPHHESVHETLDGAVSAIKSHIDAHEKYSKKG